VSDALVGRDGELARLLALLDAAAAGQPAQALVSGDAGVGKTRLITELAGRAGARGFTVLSGRCAELGDSIPYLPLADALRNVYDPVLRDAIAARPVLGRLLPDRTADQPPADLPGLAQQQLFGAVLGLLSELAAARPVLLVLEDLHWADRSTRDLITFLSRVLHRERVAIVASYRTDDLHRRHPLRPVVAELLRLPGVAAVELSPLADQAMADHLTALATAPLEAAALERLVARADGNPYYGEELLAAGDAGLPAGLADLLLARFEQVSSEAQRVLRAAAVAGRQMDDEIVLQAAGLAAGDYEAAIRESVAHQLLVPDGSRGYAFRHALIREAIYADLLPGERTRLHARLAELLSDSGRLASVPGTAAELAHHCLASHDIAGAFTASVRAAQEAERLAAPAEAHRHYDQALALWDRVSDPERLAGRSRAKLAFASASSTGASGDVPRAVQKFRRLREYVHDDPVLTSRVCERLAYYLLETDAAHDAAEAARAAVDVIPQDPPRWERARALATYAETLVYAKDQFSGSGQDEPAAGRLAEKARAAAREVGAAWVEADALVTLGLLSERQGRPDDAIGQFTLAYRQARDARMLGVELRAAFQLARCHLERGDLAEAARVAHHGVARAEDNGLGLAPYGLDLQYLHYLAHFADGQWDHAQQVADGFAVRVTTVAEARLSAMALFIDVARGNPAAGDRQVWLRPFAERDRFAAYIAQGLVAEHALWRGDTTEALAQARAALGTLARKEGYSPAAIRVAAVGLAAHADRAAACRAAGDEEAALAEAAAAKTLIDAAREGSAFAQQPQRVLGPEARGWLARAEAEWQRAQGSNDPVHWRAVLDAFGPAFTYEAARTRWRLAQALAEAGRREEAQHEWDLAAGVAQRLGAVPLSNALADLARRARLSPQRYRSPGPLAALTPREAQVLRLIARGASNREIAASLFIAPKTASVHVSNILAKLGASTRTEAAAIAHGEAPLAGGGPQA
jgi:DNA-binding CsgD family transcriptional regulator/tetratricopeptide (TPR) repeat protein